MVLARIANAFLVAFATDGGLSALEDVLRRISGASSFITARHFFAWAVTCAAIALLPLLALTPRLPKRILLPPILFCVWRAVGAPPLPLLGWTGEALQLAGTLVQGSLAFLALRSARRHARGMSWLLTPESLVGPLFRWKSTAAFAAVLVLVSPPLLGVALALGAAAWLQTGTAGFVRFDRAGVTLGDRRYDGDAHEVRLVGMMHVGEGEAYEQVFASFEDEDTVVLEEGVTDEEDVLAFPLAYESVAATLGLDVQPPVNPARRPANGKDDTREWPHFRHADVDASRFSPETVEFLRRTSELWAAENGGLGAFLGIVRWAGAPENASVLRHVEEDLLRARNRHLIAALDEALLDYRSVVVPWGALHLPEIERALEVRGFKQRSETRRRLLEWSTIAGALGVGAANRPEASHSAP